MPFELPVVWKLEDTTYAGGLRLTDDSLTLTSNSRTLGFLRDSIASLAIERRPNQRLRGLPVLCLRLASGADVRIASLGGAGSLQELAAAVAVCQAVATGT